MTNPEPLRQTVPASTIFTPEVRSAAIAALGSDGAWLLLSQLLYGWRANYDLAVAATTGLKPAHRDGEGRPGPVDHEFQIVTDFHVQGLLFAATEQLVTLMRACRAHINGKDFFRTFVDPDSNINSLFDQVDKYGRAGIESTLGLPVSVNDVLAEVRALRDDPPLSTYGDPVLELANNSTQLSSGLLIPNSAMEHEAAQGMADQTVALVDSIMKSLEQLRSSMIDKPTAVNAPPEVTPEPLRKVDNAFRHGHRVLYHGAVPEDRTFGVVSLNELERQSHAVDLFIKGDTVEFATIDCSPERTSAHVETIRQVCLLIGRISRAFLGRHALGRVGWTLVATQLHLGEDDLHDE